MLLLCMFFLFFSLSLSTYAIFVASDPASISVKHYLFISLPNLLLTEIQLPKAAFPLHYQISNYKLCHCFRLNGGVHVYCSTKKHVLLAFWILSLPTLMSSGLRFPYFLKVCFLHSSPIPPTMDNSLTDFLL